MSQMYQILSGHTSDVTCVDFTGTKLLVSGSNDKTVRLWESDENGHFKQTLLLTDHTYGVNCVRFSPFGTFITSCSTDGNIILWNTNTGKHVVKLSHPSGCAIRVCSFSPSSALLATGGDDDGVIIWDITTRSMIRSLSDHEAMITAIAFTPDSAYLISGSTAGDIKLWDLKSGHEKPLVTIIEAHDLGVTSCDFCHQCNVNENPYILASCGNDDLIKLWHVSGESRFTITKFNSLKGHSGNVNCCKFSTDGKFLASAAGDKTVIIWDPQTGNILHELKGHNRYVTCCVFSSDNSIIATGSNDKSVIIWKLADMKERSITIVNDT